MNSYFQTSTSLRAASISSPNQGSIITVRTSQKTYQSIGSGIEDTGHPLSTGSFNAYAVKKTASFTAIHREVSGVQSSLMSYSSTSSSGNSRGREEGATGEYTSPVGDVLLPMLAIVSTYLFIKIFRNSKISKAL